MDCHALYGVVEVLASIGGAALIMVLFVWLFDQIENNLK